MNYFNLLVCAVLAALFITGLASFFAKAIHLKAKNKEWIDLEIRDINLNHFCQDIFLGYPKTLREIHRHNGALYQAKEHKNGANSLTRHFVQGFVFEHLTKM